MALVSTYSFLDVFVGVQGPGISAELGGGNGVAEEGVVVTMAEDKSTMLVGVDGGAAHSLHASNAGTITITLLKTNPLNHMLQAAYNQQKTTSALWGKNVITISNPARGDLVTAREGAFKRQPDFANAKEAGTVQWQWDCVSIQQYIGDGRPNAA